MANDAHTAALHWLAETGFEVTFRHKDGQTWIARRREDQRLKPGLEVPYPEQEVGLVFVCSATIASGIAQGRLNRVRRWKARAKGRLVAVVAHRSLEESDLIFLKGLDLVQRWPIPATYPHQTGPSPS